MPKKAAKAKREQQLSDRELELAGRLFVKLYDPARGKTTEHIAAEAIEAAKVFATVLSIVNEE